MAGAAPTRDARQRPANVLNVLGMRIVPDLAAEALGGSPS